MILTPQGNNLIVKREKAKDRTATGIFVQVDTKATEHGKVVTKGKDASIKVGTHVVFNSFDRDELTLEGCDDLVIIPQDKIQATIK